MLYRRQVSVSIFHPAFALSTVFILLLSSCGPFKKLTRPHVTGYQYGKPFVYSTNIKVEGNIPASEKKDLALRLSNQLDDSLRVQIVSLAGVYKKVVRPPAYDSANMRRSIGYMVALLNASGYYSPIIKDTVHTDTVRKGKNH